MKVHSGAPVDQPAVLNDISSHQKTPDSNFVAHSLISP